MAGAIEQAIECGVHLVELMRPNTKFLLRVHPGVGAGWQEARVPRLEPLIDVRDFALELICEPDERVDRAVGLELDQMERQLVGPAHVAALDIAHDGTGLGFEQPVGNGTNDERLGIDDHVLELDPDRLEQAETGGHSLAGATPRSSSLVRKYCMMDR